MKNKKAKLLAMSVLLFVGIVFISFGIYASITGNIDAKLNGILFGLGAGLIGASLAQIASIRLYTNNPKLLKQKTIEVSDERNTVIRNKAKSKVFDLFNSLFPIIILGFAIYMDNILWLFVLLAFYFLHFILYFVYVNKYNKEM